MARLLKTIALGFVLLPALPSWAHAQLRFTSTPPTTAEAGLPYRYVMMATLGDANDAGVQYYATTLPRWLTFDSRNTLSGTPAATDIGQHDVALIAVRRFSFVSQVFTITVAPADRPPSLPDPPPALTQYEDTPLTLTATMLGAVDERPDLLTVELLQPPDGARYSVDGTATVVPEADYFGPLSVPVRVRDSRAYSNTVNARIDVLPVNDAPRLDAIPPMTAGAGEVITIELADYATDPEGDALTFSIDAAVDAHSLDPATGRFTMVAPALPDPVDRQIAFSVSDGAATSVGAFRLTLLGVGRADLASEISVSPNPARVDDAQTLTLTVRHAGGLDAGPFVLDAQVIATAPIVVDAPSDPACTASPASDGATVGCQWSGMPSGGAIAVEVPIVMSEPGELFATGTVSSLPGSPIDEHAVNDRAAIAWLVAGNPGEGPSESLPAPELRALAAGDFDADGLDDIAAAPAGAAPLRLHMNRIDPQSGVRAFANATTVGSAVRAVALAVSDLDADGHDDIVIAAEDGHHTVLRSRGDGSFDEVALEPAGSGTRAVTIVDVDGDGLDDLIFVGLSNASNRLYRNLGALAFERLALGSTGASIGVIDAPLGVQGQPALLLLGIDDLYLLEAQGGAFGTPLALSTGPALTAAAGDFDGDTLADLVVAGDDDIDFAGALYTNTGDPLARFSLASELTRIGAGAVFAADVDADGMNDVIALGRDGVHRVFMNQGSSGFRLNAQLFATEGAAPGFAATLGHFTHPERIDVAVAGPDSIAVFRNDGHGRFGRGDRTPPVLTLLGEENVTVTIGQQYVDPGATATDDMDGDITDRIAVTNAVNVEVVGDYQVTYDVRDRAGNRAETRVRDVAVVPRTEGGGGGGAFAPGAVFVLALLAGVGLLGTPQRAAAQLSYTYVDFRVVSNDVSASGTQEGSGGQTVTLQSDDGDGISVAGSVALPGRFYFLGSYSSSILDVAATIDSPLTEVSVTDEYDLTVSSIGFGYAYPISERLGLTVELTRDRAQLDFGSLVGEEFDTSRSGIGTRIGFRYMPNDPLEIYASIGQSPFAETHLDTRSLDSGSTVNAGLRWYFLPDLGAGIDYRSGDLAAWTLSMRFNFGRLPW